MNFNNQFYTLASTHMTGLPNYAAYQPESLINTQLQKQNQINSSWKHRQYLQRNAKDIMKHNTMEHIQASGNNPYIIVPDNISTTNIPYTFKNVHDTSSPAFGLNDSDLKRNYMIKERINSRMIAPTIPTNF